MHQNKETFPEGNLLEFCEIFTPGHCLCDWASSYWSDLISVAYRHLLIQDHENDSIGDYDADDTGFYFAGSMKDSFIMLVDIKNVYMERKNNWSFYVTH
jgi:hypothetical protein